jgi:hypothetical protein
MTVTLTPPRVAASNLPMILFATVILECGGLPRRTKIDPSLNTRREACRARLFSALRTSAIIELTEID